MAGTLNWDVIVVGSGPAGAMAAYELAKAGLKVAILEKKLFRGTKPAAGALFFEGVKCSPSQFKLP